MSSIKGVLTLYSVNTETITHFLGIRYAAAAPTGKVSLAFKLFIKSFITLKTGSRRFREPQLPSFTPGVQLAITISIISSDRPVSTVLLNCLKNYLLMTR